MSTPPSAHQWHHASEKWADRASEGKKVAGSQQKVGLETTFPTKSYYVQPNILRIK
jgi:hypothetical protein